MRPPTVKIVLALMNEPPPWRRKRPAPYDRFRRDVSDPSIIVPIRLSMFMMLRLSAFDLRR
jgi:hypothetical protein